MKVNVCYMLQQITVNDNEVCLRVLFVSVSLSYLNKIH